QRRVSAVRGFYGWLHRSGRIAQDPAALLKAPRSGRRLPHAPDSDAVARMLDGAVDADDPVGLRDRAILEVLYASGIRVSELCGLDVDDLDSGRGTVRVLGKGNKERTAPMGTPALRALADWLGVRRQLATPTSGPALFLGERGGRIDPR